MHADDREEEIVHVLQLILGRQCEIAIDAVASMCYLVCIIAWEAACSTVGLLHAAYTSISIRHVSWLPTSTNKHGVVSGSTDRWLPNTRVISRVVASLLLTANGRIPGDLCI
jgi:hypothetical protein